MRSATGVLPASLSAPRLSARLWMVLAAGVGCGVCAYAGLYPRFDDGKLRIVVALTCAPFAAAVVGAALGARDGAKAFGRAVLFAAILGMAATIVPAAILARGSDQFVFGCVFGAFFGAITGALYGLPLAVMCAVGHRHVRAATHEATDRAARASGVWLFVVAVIGLAGTLVLDVPTVDYPSETAIAVAPSIVPVVVACAAGLAAVGVVVRAIMRISRRAAWIGRVRSGLEPAFRLRAADPRDRMDGLPRLGDFREPASREPNDLGDDATVVEWCPEETSADTAYRIAAAGTAVALVNDRLITV